MKMRMNVIIAIMVTFCFTATLFLAIPIRSANSPYDPWIDYNDDGKISLQDLVSLANSYGTIGDPTKNVTVTNWPFVGGSQPNVLQVNGSDPQPTYALYQGTINLTSNGWINPTINCIGYSRLSVLLTVKALNIGLNNSGKAEVTHLVWSTLGDISANPIANETVPSVYVPMWTDMYGGTTVSQDLCPYVSEIKGAYCYLQFDYGFYFPSVPPPNWYVTVDYAVYLRNE